MPKINQEEYEVLKDLDDKWKWIARDKDGTLVMGAGKNERYLDGWFPPENIGDSLVVDETNAVKDVSEWGNLFQFIQWEDEPYKIAELIEEYEDSKEYKDSLVIEYFMDKAKESEEKEVKKDLNWFKEKLELLKEIDRKMWEKSEPNSKNQSHFNGSMATIDKVLDFLSQLDEPEVLSQEFIDKYKVDYDNWMPAVPIVHLQNLLVPKREVSMIPNYVAKWISRHHGQFDLYPALKRLENNMSSWENVYEWYRENTRNFVNAYLTGEYEIEQEPKYYVIDKEDNILLIRGYEGIEKADNLKITNSGGGALKLTEKEIKDYDERYWAFRKPVEELEE